MSNNPIDIRLGKIKDCLYRASAKAIIIRDGKILLVEETEQWWSLPGGGIDHGEDVAETLKRELSEELGIEQEAIQVDDRILYAEIGHIVEQIPRISLVYKVKLHDEKINKTDHIIGYNWFTAVELEDLCISPTVGGKTRILQYFN